MNPGLDSVTAMVQQLWPRYKASIQPMWDTRLHRYDVETIRAILWAYRADHPDDTKPVWRTVYSMLSGGDQTHKGQSDLQCLLDSVRRAIVADPKWSKVKPPRIWTDADLVENHIDANVRPILRDMTGKAKPDDDGRLAKLAARARVAIVEPLILDLTERGETVPEWLVR